MKIETNKGQAASFYIARVGNVGKPLRTPYTSNNSFAVISSDPEMDFQRVKTAYEAGAFKPFGYGTCQLQIRIGDVRNVIAKCAGMDTKYLQAMAAIQANIDAEMAKLKKQEQLLAEMQRAVFANC